MSEWNHREEAERLLAIARQVIKGADAKREADLSDPDLSERRQREIRDVRFDAHLAVSDLLAVANLHARLAENLPRPVALTLHNDGRGFVDPTDVASVTEVYEFPGTANPPETYINLKSGASLSVKGQVDDVLSKLGIS